MAISRGAGTEIIRSIILEDVDSNGREIIIGVQHHIYTVLSVVVKCLVSNSSASNGFIYLNGYDSSAGTTNRSLHLFQWPLVANETFVWNDKWSFNGHEPTNFAGPMDSIVKQDAIADQGSSVSQKLIVYTTNSADRLDVFCTYIDQNNA